MPSRGLVKRATLLKNLEKVIHRIPTIDLPANVRAIYAFGGILRDKNKLHDCDLVFLYSMTKDQELRWQKFRDNFSTYGIDSNARKHPLAELSPVFAPFMKQEIPLQEAVKDEKVAQILSQKGIPPSWAGCFSWTEITQGYHGDGIFYPDLERVLRRMLIGKRVRGLQIQIQPYEEFMSGHTMLVAKNYVLAWSPEKPNIEENIEGRTQQDKIEYITKELDHFINHELPRLINGGELWRGYQTARDSVSKKSTEASISIDLVALDKQHVEIVLSGSESYEELTQKCELVRCEMRKYLRETIVLEAIESAIDRWQELKNNLYFKRYVAEEFVAQWVIENTKKKTVKEKDIRQVLRTLSLPEDQVITIRGYGFTYYRLPENEEDKQKLLKEAKVENRRRKYIQKITKALKPLEKDVSVRVALNDNLEPKSLLIEVYKHVDQNEEKERDTITRDLKTRNFKVETYSWAIYGVKGAELTGKESINQLQEIAKRMLTEA
jgi:hypothetical protein